jgi:hypothetical protein
MLTLSKKLVQRKMAPETVRTNFATQALTERDISGALPSIDDLASTIDDLSWSHR